MRHLSRQNALPFDSSIALAPFNAFAIGGKDQSNIVGLVGAARVDDRRVAFKRLVVGHLANQRELEEWLSRYIGDDRRPGAHIGVDRQSAESRWLRLPVYTSAIDAT